MHRLSRIHSAAIRRRSACWVRKYQDRLFNTVLHVTGSREESEDVVQEAFVQAFLKLSTFQRNSGFYTWLYRIAVNTAVSRRRRKRVEASLDNGKEQGGHEPHDRTEAVEDRVLREERAKLLQSAMAALPEDFRSILVLREMEGFDYEQIAEVLDLPLGTVRSRLHRARIQLRDFLKNSLEDASAV